MRGETYFEWHDGLLALCRKSGKNIIKTVANNTHYTKTFRCDNAKKDLLSGEVVSEKIFDIEPFEIRIFLAERK